MRAGQMDRVITLQRVTTAPTDSGAVSEVWNSVVTLRAQLVSTAVEEINKAQGDTTNIAVTSMLSRLLHTAGCSNQSTREYECRGSRTVV